MRVSRVHILGLACACVWVSLGCGEDDRKADVSRPSTPLCDNLEPNEVLAQATPLGVPQSALTSAICANDVDWFEVRVEAGEVLTARLEFEHEAGDLDVGLYNILMGEMTLSNSADSDEFLQLPIEVSGLYYLKVFGYKGGASDYGLRVEVDGGLGFSCPDDELEENDSPATATALLFGVDIEGVLCGGDVDLFRLEVEPGDLVEVGLKFSHARGDLELRLVDEGGRALTEGSSSSDNELLTFEAVQASSIFVEVLGYEGAQNDYVLTVTRAQEYPTEGFEVIGSVVFEDPVFDQEIGMYGASVMTTLPGGRVEVLEGSTGEVLGGGEIEGDGSFSAFYTSREGEMIALRVLASERGEVALDVVDGQQRVYAVQDSRSFVAAPRLEGIEIVIQGGEIEPFNILEATLRGLGWWEERFGLSPELPLLHVVWESGRELSCGTCYRSDDAPPSIYLLGLNSDNDGLDDPVILHEVGHVLQVAYSTDDSPGGQHDGTPTDPRLAFSEGWATFFSAAVRDEVVYYDTVGESYTGQDVESKDPDYGEFMGQTVNDPISEYLVTSLLWDFYDDLEGEEERVSLGLRSIDPLLGYLADGELILRGAFGVDLMDYLDGLYCEAPEASEGIGGLIEATGFPYSASPVGCKPSAPMSWGMSEVGLFVEAQRPFDTMVVLECQPGRCMQITEATSGVQGERVHVSTTGSESWVEARLLRGGDRWTSIYHREVVSESLSRATSWESGALTMSGKKVIQRVNLALGSDER